MARQVGPVRFNGVIGDIVFYSAKGREFARRKPNITKERIANDPAFAPTRQNNAEFAKASRAGKELRMCLHPLICKGMDGRLVNRLNSALLKVLKSDPEGDRGQRNIMKGDITKLDGFMFNTKVSLSGILLVKPQWRIARTTGRVTTSLPEFIGDTMIKKRPGVTQCKIVTAVVALDLDKPACVADFNSSPLIALNATEPEDIVIINKIPPGNGLPLMLIIGLQMYYANEKSFRMSENDSYTPLEVMDVDIKGS